MATRAHFEQLEYANGALNVSGWMFDPSRQVERFQLLVDDRPQVEVEPTGRADVARHFPRHPTALNSGYRFSLPASPGTFEEWCEIEIKAFGARNAELGRTSIPFRPGFLPRVSPPSELMSRVSNVSDRDTFWRVGLQCYGRFQRALHEGLAGRTPRRVLDWGCGCGRVVALFLEHSRVPELFGCDIDPRAVAWCSEHLRPAKFATIAPDPPLPYADGAFDVVLANSVFTHLDRQRQLDWLRELRRVLAPGGLLLATTQGPFVADLLMGAAFTDELERAGIADQQVKDTLVGIAPEAYYREVYQTEAYTRSTWSREFEVLAFEEAGMCSYQDFWTLRKS